MTYLLAIAAATLLRAVAIAAAIARATVVQLRLVAKAIAGIATSEFGPGVTLSIVYNRPIINLIIQRLSIDKDRYSLVSSH